MSSVPILITSGEPSGIGPDLSQLLAAQDALNHVRVLSSPEVFAVCRDTLGLDVVISSVTQHNALYVLPIQTVTRICNGQPDPANTRHVIPLGLPYIRISVDHGTVRNLAGSGNADCGSLCAALESAMTMSAKHNPQEQKHG